MTAVPDPATSSTRPSSPESSQLGVADLLGRLNDQLTTLVRQEIELAKTEAKQELTTAAKAGARFGAAGLAGWFGVLFLSLAAAWGLAEVMAPGLAFLIVGVVYVLVAVVLGLQAKKKADQVDPGLEQTTDSLRETTEWAKDTHND